jgi:RHS repeat-associated protein
LIGRFISADTIVPGVGALTIAPNDKTAADLWDDGGKMSGPANSQELNRYSYVNNNPVRYTDPTGHWSMYGRFDNALSYMHNQMFLNVRSRKVGEMRGLLNAARRNPLHHAASIWRAKALRKWKNLVCGGCVWDHKPKLRRRLGLHRTPPNGDYNFPIRGGGRFEYYYDIWSNIHYGYVGRSIGFTRATLQAGAWAAGPGRHTRSDRIAVGIGIDLWNDFGRGLTKQQLHNRILRHKRQLDRQLWDNGF